MNIAKRYAPCPHHPWLLLRFAASIGCRKELYSTGTCRGEGILGFYRGKETVKLRVRIIVKCQSNGDLVATVGLPCSNNELEVFYTLTWRRYAEKKSDGTWAVRLCPGHSKYRASPDNTHRHLHSRWLPADMRRGRR